MNPVLGPSDCVRSAAHVEPLGARDAEADFRQLLDRPHVAFLDSARRDPALGRYSYLAVDPFEVVCCELDEPDALATFAARMRRWRAAPLADMPPFQGGGIGYLSYDLGRQLERLPPPRFDPLALPALWMGLYDVVLAYDHERGESWLVSHGFPELDPLRVRARARRRAEQLLQWLAAPSPAPVQAAAEHPAPLPHAPQFATDACDGVTSDFSGAGYRAAVRRAIEYIRAGDVFQVNITQRLLHPATSSSGELYLRLRRRNPAPFAAYLDAGSFQIVSASPERFVRVLEGEVETRPIKGTRPLRAGPEADLFAGDELRASLKDRAENVMIVDLLRNDLARVCRADSVRVSELCRLETYEFVQHLVSVVTGRLRDELGAFDLLRASFPGGSITGAPKVRAMELIAELEPTARGPYCGALGYWGFDGAMDTNILIRTITAARGWWQFGVGGGIVADSDPDREVEESWHKARGLLRAFA